MPDFWTPGRDDVISEQLEDHLNSLRPSTTPPFTTLQRRKRSRNRVRRSTAAITLAVLGVAGVTVLTSAGTGFLAQPPSGVWPAQSPSGAPVQRVDPADPANPSYRINASGLTYGSSANALSPGTEPDLIAVVATNGKEGFAHKTDLDDATGQTASRSFTSPQDALRWQESTDRLADQHVTVYEADGTTVVGSFLVAGSMTRAKDMRELAERSKSLSSPTADSSRPSKATP